MHILGQIHEALRNEITTIGSFIILTDDYSTP